jgi:hypothetical protein
MGTSTASLLLQKFLNGDVDLRSIEQRDLRVGIFSFSLSDSNLLFF